MMKSIKILKKYFITKFKIFIILLFSFPSIAEDIDIIIDGNDFSDDNAILSIIDEKPTALNKEYSNYLLKELYNSKLFKNVTVNIENNKYVVYVEEYPNINKFYFVNNERLKDEDLDNIIKELNVNNLNPSSINVLIDEIEKIYASFGYNNINIDVDQNVDKKTNTADVKLFFDEGKITKIKNIYFEGNELVDSENLKSQIKSKTKTLKNIFANNNYKEFVVKNDTRKISNYYKNLGYKNIKVDYNIEYLETNNVNVYFKIIEGERFFFEKIEYLDENNLLNNETRLRIDDLINNSLAKDNFYSIDKINDIKDQISTNIIDSGINFFEINPLERENKNNIDILYQIIKLDPVYTNQINIFGNKRTFDYVIRRELNISEGDPINKNQLKDIENKLKSLNLFQTVEINEVYIDDNLIDIEINVEEKQTGSVNAGLAIGTIEGFSVLAGLSERNFGGTGRSVDILVNTSEDRNEFTFETTDRLNFEDNLDLKFTSKYKQEDFSTSSSYKLDTFLVGLGIGYDINPSLRHNISLDYVIKDYIITNASTVSSSIDKSSGSNVSFLLNNNIFYSTLNSLYLPKNGQYFSFINSIETPTSSSNGYIRNVVTYKNFKKFNKNIISNQTRFGNIVSLSDNDILTDNKFSLGGRWLRGFDVSGAGPRNSATSYVGGENLIVTKFDFSREIFDNTDFPVYLNFFNDYGMVWQNKTKPTQDDNSIRASYGFGIKYYSPIGPIGLSWGFPLIDESYDIKRMFLFSVGNID